MTGRNALSTELIKPTGEQAIVSVVVIFMSSMKNCNWGCLIYPSFTVFFRPPRHYFLDVCIFFVIVIIYLCGKKKKNTNTKVIGSLWYHDMVTVAKPLSEFALASNKFQLDQFVKRRRILAGAQICKDRIQVFKEKYLFSMFSSLSCNLMLVVIEGNCYKWKKTNTSCYCLSTVHL